METRPQTPTPPAAPAGARSRTGFAALLPGLAVCAAATAVVLVLAGLLPGVSALLMAILLGAAWRNLLPVPASWQPGVKLASKRVLRIGIVLLGLQLSLGQILGLGAGVLLVVVAAVGLTFWFTLWLGRRMGIAPNQRLLVASGFSICGAAAVAATESATDAEEHETATAIGLVVLFGTLMIPTVPFLGALLGLAPEATGLWIGASTHEVAQVVAAGGAVGATALAVAVTVKLARVLMLAPIIAGLSWKRRREGAAPEGGKLPPIVPLFVAGFLAAVVVRSTGWLPEPVLGVGAWLQTALLAGAMFALGLGVHVKSIVKVGGRSLVLAAASTAFILAIGLGGALLFAPGA